MSGDLFSSLSLASRALDAQRAGMDVVGQNIANVNTAGYSRRVVDIATVTPLNYSSAERGAEVVSVRALRDRLLDRRLIQDVPNEQREAAVARSLSVVRARWGSPGSRSTPTSNRSSTPSPTWPKIRPPPSPATRSRSRAIR